MTNSIDFRALSQATLSNNSFIQKILPEAKREGKELRAATIHGGQGHSFSLNTETGMWSDFATGEKGGDVISLVAAQKKISQVEAAKWIAGEISFALPEARPDTKKLARKDKNLKECPVDWNNPTKIFTYFLPDGKPAFYVLRWEKAGYCKAIRQSIGYDENGYFIRNNKGAKLVPYNLVGTNKQAGVIKSDTVIIVEGENKADALIKLGLCASTNAGGASKWRKEYNIFFEKKNIIILPDNDESGRKHAEQVASELMSVASSVKVVTLPDLPDKGDIIDWLKNTDNDKHKLLSLFENAKLYTIPQTQTGERPTIYYQISSINESFKEFERCLLSIQVVYQQNGNLVRVIRLPKKLVRNGITRQSNTSLIKIIDKESLAYLSEQNFDFLSWHSKRGVFLPCLPPDALLSGLLSAQGNWKFPVLSGLVNAPNLRPDGSIIDKEGYDENTGLFADFGGVEFPAVPEKPTLEDAKKALSVLNDAIREFCFANEEKTEDIQSENSPAITEKVNRNVALAAILTAVMRKAVPSAPMFAFSAPSPATGKSTLANLIGIIATGTKCPMVNFPESRDELEKAVFSILLEGAPVVLIDNIVGTFNSPILNIVLSEESLKGRILGVSKTASVDTSALWLATGNNLTVSRDMTRRVLVCRLDAQMERPELRRFDRPNLTFWIESKRPELVVDALTILKAFILAGKPEISTLTPMAGYQEWSDLVRGSLHWVQSDGQFSATWADDPLLTQQREYGEDPEMEALAEVLTAWHSYYGDKIVSAKQIISDGEKSPVYAAIKNATANLGKQFTSLDVGYWLRKNKDLPCSGMKLTRRKSVKKIAYWQMKYISY